MNRRTALAAIATLVFLLPLLAGCDGSNTAAGGRSTAPERERQVAALAEVTLRIDGMT